MLSINKMTVQIQDEDKKHHKTILNDFSLTIRPGELHVLMGPNGCGKSTLSNTLAGKPHYVVTDGGVEFDGKDLLSLDPEERAIAGIFLAFQNPVEIPGVNNLYFLRTAYNTIRAEKKLPPLDAVDFLALVKEKMKKVGLDSSFLHRGLNEGFSGGEKKRNEILQLLVLEPKLVMLDEPDSGLDIDAVQMVAKCINEMRTKDRSFLVVTHYQKLLDEIKPDVVHVMLNGKIIRSGDSSLVESIHQAGYASIESEAI